MDNNTAHFNNLCAFIDKSRKYKIKEFELTLKDKNKNI